MFSQYIHRVIFSIKEHALKLKFYLYTREQYPVYFLIIAPTLFVTIVAVSYLAINQYESSRRLHCLTMNIYHEARGEPLKGQYAVARVTLNRVASRHYPNTICEVVHQKRWDYLRKRYVSAFSWTELPPRPNIKDKAWKQALKIAKEVYQNQTTENNLHGALFYHARYIKPSWARKKKPIARIGKHIFYK
jgi:spore germination cell wall hydrolase CwlJ-like protein